MRYLSFFAVVMSAFVASWLAPSSADAWGKYGHLTVCDLAYRNLTPASRAAITDLMRSRSGGITVRGRGKAADRHYTSFNIGCLEEDALPRRHPEDHFINVDRQTSAISSDVCPRNGDCILSGIKRDFEILRDTGRSREDRVFALMALGHWVGDVHQPLHVSFADDRGGNYIEASTEGRCGSSRYRVENLHAVWDNCLLEAGLFERVRQGPGFRTSWGPNTITYRAVDALQAATSLADERRIVGTDRQPWINDPWRWANESYQITLDPTVLYCTRRAGQCAYDASMITLPRNGTRRQLTISQAYLRSHEATARERIRRAGFRLAHLINLALDPNYSGPVRDPTQRP